MEGEAQMIRDIFKSDITIKIISVLLGILLWLYVLNIDNPYEEKSLTIPLSIENRNVLQEKSLSLLNEDNINRNVEVIVRGRKEVINNVKSSDFEAVVDFAKIESEKDKTLRVELHHDIDDITISLLVPRSINIKLENIVKGDFAVDVEVTGKPKEGYKVINMTQIPEEVTIEDIESIIETVGSIRSVVDISGLDKDKTIKKECKIYNKEGKEIPTTDKNLSVEVKFEVAREVPIVPALKGKPANDYVEGQKILNPDKALIAGPSDIISNITELKTEPVDISNTKGNINVTSLINLPEGVRLIDTPKEVSVNVIIEELVEKKLTVQKDLISFENFAKDNTLDYNVLADSVEVTVKGRRASINSITESSLKPIVNVSGLNEGTHQLLLKFTIPLDVKLIGEPKTDVKISKKPQEQVNEEEKERQQENGENEREKE